MTLVERIQRLIEAEGRTAHAYAITLVTDEGPVSVYASSTSIAALAVIGAIEVLKADIIASHAAGEDELLEDPTFGGGN